MTELSRPEETVLETTITGPVSKLETTSLLVLSAVYLFVLYINIDLLQEKVQIYGTSTYAITPTLLKIVAMVP